MYVNHQTTIRSEREAVLRAVVLSAAGALSGELILPQVLYDVLGPLEWPRAIDGRALRNRFIDDNPDETLAKVGLADIPHLRAREKSAVLIDSPCA